MINRAAESPFIQVQAAGASSSCKLAICKSPAARLQARVDIKEKYSQESRTRPNMKQEKNGVGDLNSKPSLPRKQLELQEREQQAR